MLQLILTLVSQPHQCQSPCPSRETGSPRYHTQGKSKTATWFYTLYLNRDQVASIIIYLLRLKKQAASGSIPKWEAKQHQATCPGRHGAAPSTTTIKGTSMARDWRKETKPLQGWGTLHHNLIVKEPTKCNLLLQYGSQSLTMVCGAELPGHWGETVSTCCCSTRPLTTTFFSDLTVEHTSW